MCLEVAVHKVTFMDLSLGREERASVAPSKGFRVFSLHVWLHGPQQQPPPPTTSLSPRGLCLHPSGRSTFLFYPQTANSSSSSQFQAKNGLQAAGLPWVSCSGLGNSA